MERWRSGRSDLSAAPTCQPQPVGALRAAWPSICGVHLVSRSREATLWLKKSRASNRATPPRNSIGFWTLPSFPKPQLPPALQSWRSRAPINSQEPFKPLVACAHRGSVTRRLPGPSFYYALAPASATSTELSLKSLAIPRSSSLTRKTPVLEAHHTSSTTTGCRASTPGSEARVDQGSFSWDLQRSVSTRDYSPVRNDVMSDVPDCMLTLTFLPTLLYADFTNSVRSVERLRLLQRPGRGRRRHTWRRVA